MAGFFFLKIARRGSDEELEQSRYVREFISTGLKDDKQFVVDDLFVPDFITNAMLKVYPKSSLAQIMLLDLFGVKTTLSILLFG